MLIELTLVMRVVSRLHWIYVQQTTRMANHTIFGYIINHRKIVVVLSLLLIEPDNPAAQFGPAESPRGFEAIGRAYLDLP